MNLYKKYLLFFLLTATGISHAKTSERSTFSDLCSFVLRTGIMLKAGQLSNQWMDKYCNIVYRCDAEEVLNMGSGSDSIRILTSDLCARIIIYHIAKEFLNFVDNKKWDYRDFCSYLLGILL